MNPQVVGANTDTVTINYQPNLNMKDYFTNVSATANTEHYQDRIKLNEWTSDTTSTSPYSNIEYNIKENFQAEVDVGMQPPYSAIVSTPVKIRDIQIPDGNLRHTSVDAPYGANLDSLTRTEIGNVSDNSGLAVDTLISVDTENSYIDANNYRHTNSSAKLEDKFGNIRDLGLLEIVQPAYATAVNDNPDQEKFEVTPIYSGNKVSLKAKTDSYGTVTMDFYDMSARILQKKQFQATPGAETTIDLEEFGPGVYGVRSVEKKQNGEVEVDKDKFIVR
jgi:hypothetical protein